MVKNKKCIVMFSGGLDSRLALKIMQAQGFDVLAVHFILPFGTGCCNNGCAFNFSQVSGIELKLFDCSKGKLLQEYIDVIKKPKYSRGSSMNPCIDCRIFMLKHAKKFADKNKIKYIVTGEVLGQRPMSQQPKQIKLIEKESGLSGRIIRPLIDFYNIHGRSRKKQIQLARKFGIKYPNSAGGCLLCEKALKERLKFLLNRGLDEEEVKLVNIGRHFNINGCWVVIGRDEKENKVIEKIKNKKYELIIPNYPAPSALILDNDKFDKKTNKKIKDKVNELIKAYSKKGSINDRKKFDKYKL